MEPESPRPDGSARATTTRLAPEEFARLFESASRLFWCIAAGILGSPAGAQDILQHSALIALERLDEFDPGEQGGRAAAARFIAWMSQIVRHTAMNERRKTSRRRTPPVDPARLDHAHTSRPASPPPPVLSGRGQLLDHEAFDDRVLAALGQLDETARACLLMRTLLDLPYRDISLALDLPEGTAMSHVHRARRAVRERLSVRASPAGRSSL